MATQQNAAFTATFQPTLVPQVPSMPSHANTAALVLGAITCVFAVSAHAGPDYRCTIVQRFTASAESSEVKKAQERAHIGKQFSVERKTGIMTGALQNAYAVDPEVMDYGSAESAYKVVTAMKKDDGAGFGSNIYALTINEHEKSAQKPFVFLENDKVYLGHCVPF